MNSRIHDIAKEIKYLKSNLSTVDGSFKMRMQEEIHNLEFDLEYLKRLSYIEDHTNRELRPQTTVLSH